MADKLSVLRACHQALRPGGRIAGYTIHTPDHLDARRTARAAELGPRSVLAQTSPEALLRAAGFSRVRAEDVTTEFSETARAFVAARERHAEALRREDGDAVFDEEQRSMTATLEGIGEGLLLRSLHVAERS